MSEVLRAFHAPNVCYSYSLMCEQSLTPLRLAVHRRPVDQQPDMPLTTASVSDNCYGPFSDRAFFLQLAGAQVPFQGSQAGHNIRHENLRDIELLAEHTQNPLQW